MPSSIHGSESGHKTASSHRLQVTMQHAAPQLARLNIDKLTAMEVNHSSCHVLQWQQSKMRNRPVCSKWLKITI